MGYICDAGEIDLPVSVLHNSKINLESNYNGIDIISGITNIIRSDDRINIKTHN